MKSMKILRGWAQIYARYEMKEGIGRELAIGIG